MNSTIFILILTFFRPDVAYYPAPPTDQIFVRSAKEAAVELWTRNEGERWGARWEGVLYQVDLDLKTVTEVEIPTLEFGDNGNVIHVPDSHIETSSMTISPTIIYEFSVPNPKVIFLPSQ